MRTRDGRPLRICRPGSWNRLGGPDFLQAEWELDGQKQIGDVEIHFYQRDWYAHGHHCNPAFGTVGLHVVVFDVDAGERPAETLNGIRPAVLILSPYLPSSLEEFAVRDALRLLDGSDPLDLAAPLLQMPVERRRETLQKGARRRWLHKVHFARQRLEKEGWQSSCHQLAMEILGYRANRLPMADLALKFPIDHWRDVDGGFLENCRSAVNWNLRGLRPGNHPRRRLEQYAAWMRHAPDWPDRLALALSSLPERHIGREDTDTRASRRNTELREWREEMRLKLCGQVVASPRWDTLWVDGFLPLAAARWQEASFYPFWYHWWAGDFPDRLRQFIQVSQLLSPTSPCCNGIQQGALDLLYNRDYGSEISPRLVG